MMNYTTILQHIKIERGERPAKRNQVITLASFNLLTLWLADQMYGIVEYEQNANDVLNIVAENIVEYNKSK